MFSADIYVLEFISKNWVTLTMVIGFLKILAKRSENTLDDSILGYFSSIIMPGIKKTKKNNG